MKQQPRWMIIAAALIIIYILVVVVVGFVKVSEMSDYSLYERKNSIKKSYILTAIEYYIAMTDDIGLKFGRNKPVKDVDELLSNLQKKFVYNGKECEPAITNTSDLNPDTSGRKSGWRILVNKESREIRVLLNDKNSIEFVSDADLSKISKDDFFSGSYSASGTILKWFEPLEPIIYISVFIFWNVLALICSLIVYGFAREITILRFFGYLISNIISYIIVLLLCGFLVGNLASYEIADVLLLLIFISLGIFVHRALNILFTRLFLKETFCPGFRTLLTMLTALPVIIFIFGAFISSGAIY